MGRLKGMYTWAKLGMKLRPLAKQAREVTGMKLSVNSVIQLLGLLAQGVNAATNILPDEGKFWGFVVISAIQGITGVLAHFSNPDGTSARAPYVK